MTVVAMLCALQGIEWIKDWDAAIQSAEEQGKPLFLYFTQPG